MRWIKLNKTRGAYRPPQRDASLQKPLERSLILRTAQIRELYSNSADLLIHEIKVCGVDCAVVMCEGLVDTETFSQIFARPLTELTIENATASDVMAWVQSHSLMAPDQKAARTYGELFRFIMSGFVVLLVDGIAQAQVFGLQGYPGRSVSEPEGETNVRGSREGFIEKLRPNLSLIRRRLKSPDFVFEMQTIGEKSRTDCAIVYLRGAVSPELLRSVRARLKKISIDVVLESGYIQPFLEGKMLSLFSSVGCTERPDTLCAKVAEGRVGLIVDGTPYALIVPFLFTEHFQSFDDYAHRPYFSTFIRILKYTCFALAMLLPGLYVALGSFHPELLPQSLLARLAVSEEVTPFPLMLEALLIFFLYEVMREAGLRMPKSVGHAVSIIGALVIGDAAVNAGIIGAPMVLVVALTAIGSFVVPSLYEPVTALRFAFILLGGILGVFGIFLGLCAVLVNLCALSPFGIPATAPVSPLSLYAQRDVVLRLGWRTLARQDLRVSRLRGGTRSRKGGVYKK